MEIGSKQADCIIIKNDKNEVVAVISDTVIKAIGYSVEIIRPKKEYTTLEEIEGVASDFLLPRHICNYIGCAQYSINCQVKKDPSKLGFPTTAMGSRVKIPKIPFLKYCRGEK